MKTILITICLITFVGASIKREEKDIDIPAAEVLSDYKNESSTDEAKMPFKLEETTLENPESNDRLHSGSSSSIIKFSTPLVVTIATLILLINLINV